MNLMDFMDVLQAVVKVVPLGILKMKYFLCQLCAFSVKRKAQVFILQPVHMESTIHLITYWLTG